MFNELTMAKDEKAAKFKLFWLEVISSC